MNSPDLDQLLDHFNNKISTIYSLLPLSRLYDNLNDKQSDNQWKRNAVLDSNLNNYHNSDDYRRQLEIKKPDLRQISQMVVEMKAMVDDMRISITKQRQTIEEESKLLDSDIKRLERHCDHIQQNIPTFLNNNKSDKETSSRTDPSVGAKRPVLANKNVNRKQTLNTKPRVGPQSHNLGSKPAQESKFAPKSIKKNMDSKNMRNIPKVSYITTEEYETIPKYILNRLSYETINRAVGDINRAIAAKYKLIFNYSTKYSDEEMRKYMAFKEQENSETEGQFFCSMADLKELSDLKNEMKIRQVLTCLRHCKRVKEIRGNPAKLVRYAVISDTLQQY